MLTDHVTPDQRCVAYPSQDVDYSIGFAAVDKKPIVWQVPDFGDRSWAYALYDARSGEFSKLGQQYGTKPGSYLVIGPNSKERVGEGECWLQ
jgi:hypothetical protein